MKLLHIKIYQIYQKKLLNILNDNYARSKIAKKGRDKYFKYFNSKIVADFLIKKTFGINKKYFWEKNYIIKL